jgi:hypothetical protein
MAFAGPDLVQYPMRPPERPRFYAEVPSVEILAHAFRTHADMVLAEVDRATEPVPFVKICDAAIGTGVRFPPQNLQISCSEDGQIVQGLLLPIDHGLDINIIVDGEPAHVAAAVRRQHS